MCTTLYPTYTPCLTIPGHYHASTLHCRSWPRQYNIVQVYLSSLHTFQATLTVSNLKLVIWVPHLTRAFRNSCMTLKLMFHATYIANRVEFYTLKKHATNYFKIHNKQENANEINSTVYLRRQVFRFGNQVVQFTLVTNQFSNQFILWKLTIGIRLLVAGTATL